MWSWHTRGKSSYEEVEDIPLAGAETGEQDIHLIGHLQYLSLSTLNNFNRMTESHRWQIGSSFVYCPLMLLYQTSGVVEIK